MLDIKAKKQNPARAHPEGRKILRVTDFRGNIPQPPSQSQKKVYRQARNIRLAKVPITKAALTPPRFRKEKRKRNRAIHR